MKKGRLLVGVALVLLVALVLPSTALGFSWTKSGGAPLIQGGVHSKAKFKSLMLHSTKVRTALKGVLKRNGYPSWVFNAAVSQAAAGKILSSSLVKGTHIHTMASGPGGIHYALNTVWRGRGRLPYYYVLASQTVVLGTLTQTTSYRVGLPQTCANVFVFSPKVTTSTVSPPLGTFNLFVEKRQDSLEGTRLAGWEITGTVGDTAVDVTTSDTTTTLVGQFAAGTAYDLSEMLQEGWQIVSPAGGNFTGTMPAADVTLTFVNSQVPQPPQKFNLFVEKRQDSLEGTRLAGWEVTGTVGDTNVDVTTADDAPTLVGQFAAGTAYDLSELLQEGWQIVSPADGNFTGTMPASDVTLTFVNSQVPQPPQKFNLYVEKRRDTVDGPLLAGWEITGTVGADPVDATTNDSTATLIGQFAEGTPINLSELLQSGWILVSPVEGNFNTTMPGHDLTLTFVNRQATEGTCEFLTKGFWHNQNGLAILSQHPEWIAYVNTLDPYKDNPFDGMDASGNPVPKAEGPAGNTIAGAGTALAEISNYLVAPVQGDSKTQLAEQLLAFIFNVRSCGATSIMIKGSWVTTDSIITDAISAWQTGGAQAVKMEAKLDALNNDVVQTVMH